MADNDWAKIVGSGNVTVMNTLNKMVRDGFEKPDILQIIGPAIDGAAVDAAMIRHGRTGAPVGHAQEKHRIYVDKKRQEHKNEVRVRTEAEIQAARDRMAKAREARKTRKSDGINVHE